MTNKEAREELLAMQSLLPEGMITSREALTCGANALQILAEPSPPDPRDAAIALAVEALEAAAWQFDSHAGEEDNRDMCRSALAALKAVQR